MRFLSVTKDFLDPATLRIEAVERKGVGHPDSLADALANEVSVAFSRRCLDQFGVILHHNLDKLYIGGGNFLNDFGSYQRMQPISVRTNGRMSNMFGIKHIDVELIQRNAIWQYLSKVLPHLSPEDVAIAPNTTSFHRVPYRFAPKNKGDIPHTVSLKANDTSFCVSHWPPTIAESVTYRLERYFWKEEDGFAVPRFREVGQDIKVFVLRKEKHLEITLCVPTISRYTQSHGHYRDLIRHHESSLRSLAEQLVASFGIVVSLHVNPQENPYMLGVGSCIECGEEGLVGRGNTIMGIISSHRTHTQESWAGKNPVYHTGRVLGYLTAKLARAISARLRVKCSVSTMTQCGGSLIPPEFLGVSVDSTVDQHDIESIVESEFLSSSYVEEILAFRPWLMEL